MQTSSVSDKQQGNTLHLVEEQSRFGLPAFRRQERPKTCAQENTRRHLEQVYTVNFFT